MSDLKIPCQRCTGCGQSIAADDPDGDIRVHYCDEEVNAWNFPQGKIWRDEME
jgi:hypothetical protein